MLSAAPLSIDLQPDSDSGLYADDNLTNLSTPTIDITADQAGDAIIVYRDGEMMGEAEQIEGTHYQYKFASDQLAEAENRITARSFDGEEVRTCNKLT